MDSDPDILAELCILIALKDMPHPFLTKGVMGFVGIFGSGVLHKHPHRPTMGAYVLYVCS